MSPNDFLVEIHTEELPPKSLKVLAEKFKEEIEARLTKADLKFTGAKYFATPRRLAVLVNQLQAQQPDKTIERKGPALDKAYDAAGKPTQACIGFAKSAGVDVSALIQLPGNFVGCKQDIKGKTVFEILPQVINESLAALPIPKPMRWGNHTEKFIRPVHSVMMLYGDKIIEAEILGKKAGNKTRGHRFLAPDWVEISSPADYEACLKKAYVIASYEDRRENIFRESSDLVHKNLGPTTLFPKYVDEHSIMSIDDEYRNILDEVTSLVEWPNPIFGSFDKKFLEIPLEALTSAMMNHQRYFPIYTKPNTLAPNFIAISNIKGKDEKHIVTGNERVLRARLSDAAFFYETDKKANLYSRREKLENIIFQNKLGTLLDKTKRIEKLAGYLADKFGADKEMAIKAAELSKTDLTTELVGEFPELQGIAGYYYARHENQPEVVAQSLLEQYLPKFSGDALPSSKPAMALAIADRIDTLVGIFGINQAPTGDKDPFALRRAALGILRILIENHIHLDLRELVHEASKNYLDLENKNVETDTFNFINDRFKSYSDAPNIVIASVMALNLSDPYDISERVEAIFKFLGNTEIQSLSAANKRVSNILAKYTDKITATNIQENLLESDSERHLVSQLHEQEKIIIKLNHYHEILAQLATLKTPVDDFFDNVMVMTDDKPKRENRILILKKLRGLFLHVADIALLQ